MNDKTEWRCTKCGALLGIARGRRMYLRYKQAQYIVDGGDYCITAVCRTCSTANEKSQTAERPHSAPVGK